MKRSRLLAGMLVVGLAMGSFLYTALSPSNICWGPDKTIESTICHIADHLRSEGARMSEENLNFIATTVYEESLRYNVDYRLILAIMRVESDYRQHVVSSAGARGFMQIHPSLARGLAKEAGIQYRDFTDLYDTRKNIRLGTHYISKLLILFDDMPTALFAYNVGHHKAKRLLAANRNPNTTYTRRVIAEYKRNTEKMFTL
ncbi:MAG: lytic transglycosylase domain-containing protein [Syntrophaceae bacterium]|nr:lytic transglycosylase domain-containing protein [Syntrophaceae bacterium]